MTSLFWRALLAFLLLPAMVAGVIPASLRPAGGIRHPAGLAVIGVGLALLLWCVRDFYAAGKGTLAPWDPPRRLVTTGLYRFSRNPMYVAVLVILAGWAVAYGSPTLMIYAVVVAVAFHLRVLLYEEPKMAQLFGAQWDEFRSRVPRWLLP
jgi:protein-S-isoprenylcysteine O-methyltransferase Ste14